MIFEPLPIARAFRVQPRRAEDDRGFVARTWCAREFEDHGLEPAVAQCETYFNKARGTLRGLHYQVAPHRDAALLRCTRGSIFGVIVDLRPMSATYLQHCAAVLTEDSGDALYVPEGCAQGFLTLDDETEVLYQRSAAHVAAAARGVRWNDPAFRIAWPAAPDVIAERDRTWPLL
jgi:dTDP-4-dehydrorhamnose 3,5-epimerase